MTKSLLTAVPALALATAFAFTPATADAKTRWSVGVNVGGPVYSHGCYAPTYYRPVYPAYRVYRPAYPVYHGPYYYGGPAYSNFSFSYGRW